MKEWTTDGAGQARAYNKREEGGEKKEWFEDGDNRKSSAAGSSPNRVIRHRLRLPSFIAPHVPVPQASFVHPSLPTFSLYCEGLNC